MEPKILPDWLIVGVQVRVKDASNVFNLGNWRNEVAVNQDEGSVGKQVLGDDQESVLCSTWALGTPQ